MFRMSNPASSPIYSAIQFEIVSISKQCYEIVMKITIIPEHENIRLTQIMAKYSISMVSKF